MSIGDSWHLVRNQFSVECLASGSSSGNSSRNTSKKILQQFPTDFGTTPPLLPSILSYTYRTPNLNISSTNAFLAKRALPSPFTGFRSISWLGKLELNLHVVKHEVVRILPPIMYDHSIIFPWSHQKQMICIHGNHITSHHTLSLYLAPVEKDTRPRLETITSFPFLSQSSW